MIYLKKFIQYSRQYLFMLVFITLLCGTSFFYWTEGGLYIFLLWCLIILIYLLSFVVKLKRGQL